MLYKHSLFLYIGKVELGAWVASARNPESKIGFGIFWTKNIICPILIFKYHRREKEGKNMYKVIQNLPQNVVEIIADFISDVDDLPTNYGVGSDCIVLEDSSVYMLGTDGVWHQL